MFFIIGCRELYLVYITLIYLQEMFLYSSDLDSIVSHINFETEVYDNCILTLSRYFFADWLAVVVSMLEYV